MYARSRLLRPTHAHPQSDMKMADGGDAVAPVVDPLAAPKTAPVAKEGFVTYADDAALGKPAPSLSTLEWIQGEPLKFGEGKITVLLFFAKFAKGDYTTVSATDFPTASTGNSGLSWGRGGGERERERACVGSGEAESPHGRSTCPTGGMGGALENQLTPANKPRIGHQVAGITKLAKAFAKVDNVQFVGVSVDPDKGDAEGFLKKIGTDMPEIYIYNLEVRSPPM